MSTTASTRPPAKLNLFLELLGKRPDGFHEIDTVMVAIDWCDQMRLRRTPSRDVRLSVKWLPSIQVVANRLGIDTEDQLLSIPDDSDNLVHRALRRFIDTFSVEGGFECELEKSIPAGAGMGGASSDAASALLCAARLCDIPTTSQELHAIAAAIGSDVPFFLGLEGDHRVSAARALGRGERLSPVTIASTLDFVVAFPAISLSTGKVYADSLIPSDPLDAVDLIQALESGRLGELSRRMMNRLSDPAKKLAPQIGEIIESLWQVGLRTCQLTGSGSACFAVAGSRQEASQGSSQLRSMLEPGAIVSPARSTQVPAVVNLT